MTSRNGIRMPKLLAMQQQTTATLAPKAAKPPAHHNKTRDQQRPGDKPAAHLAHARGPAAAGLDEVAQPLELGVQAGLAEVVAAGRGQRLGQHALARPALELLQQPLLLAGLRRCNFIAIWSVLTTLRPTRYMPGATCYGTESAR